MQWRMGIDGGGSKTELLLGFEPGPAAARALVGGSSLTRHPPREVRAALSAGLEQLLAAAGADRRGCAACCAGFASAGQPQNHAAYETMLRELLPQAAMEVVTDIEIAFEAAAEGGAGIVLLAGTGSGAFGQWEGKRARAGGHGPERDAGSADWIGRAAVAAGLAAAPQDGNFAALAAGLVASLADRSDMAAILAQAGEELAGLACEIAAALAWNAPRITLHGGVFAHAPAVARAAEAALRRALPLAQCLPPRRSAAQAALARAHRLRGH